MEGTTALVGNNQAAAMFESLALVAGTLHVTAFPAIAGDFHRLEAARFDSLGRGTWPELRPSTVAIKTRRRMPQPERVLYGQGGLVNSLTGFTEDTVYETNPAEMTIGTKVAYAQYHQTGPRRIKVFGRGSAILPQRKLVDIHEDDVARWALILQTALRALP